MKTRLKIKTNEIPSVATLSALNVVPMLPEYLTFNEINDSTDGLEREKGLPKTKTDDIYSTYYNRCYPN